MLQMICLRLKSKPKQIKWKIPHNYPVWSNSCQCWFYHDFQNIQQPSAMSSLQWSVFHCYLSNKWKRLSIRRGKKKKAIENNSLKTPRNQTWLSGVWSLDMGIKNNYRLDRQVGNIMITCSELSEKRFHFSKGKLIILIMNPAQLQNSLGILFVCLCLDFLFVWLVFLSCSEKPEMRNLWWFWYE